MAVDEYLKFVKKMWYAPLIWAGTGATLAYEYVKRCVSEHRSQTSPPIHAHADLSVPRQSQYVLAERPCGKACRPGC